MCVCVRERERETEKERERKRWGWGVQSNRERERDGNVHFVLCKFTFLLAVSLIDLYRLPKLRRWTS